MQHSLLAEPICQPGEELYAMTQLGSFEDQFKEAATQQLETYRNQPERGIPEKGTHARQEQISQAENISRYGIFSKNKNSQEPQFFSGLREKVVEAYTSPKEWGEAVFSKIGEKSGGMALHYQTLAEQYFVRAEQAAKHLAVETGSVLEKSIVSTFKRETSLAKFYTNSSRFLGQSSFFIKKTLIGLDVVPRVVETIKAKPGQHLRTGFENGMEFVGGLAGGVVADIGVGALGSVTGGAGLFFSIPATVGGAAVGSQLGVGLAKTIEHVIEYVDERIDNNPPSRRR